MKILPNSPMYVPPEFKALVMQIARENRKTNAEVMRSLSRCIRSGKDPVLHFKSKGWL